jgi:hypothetical protein
MLGDADHGGAKGPERLVRELLALTGATVTVERIESTYNPDLDNDGRTLRAGVRVIELVAGGRP